MLIYPVGFMEKFVEHFRDRVNALRNRGTGDKFAKYTITFKTFTMNDYPNGDNRIFEITGRHTFKDVIARINDRYSYMQPVIPLYKPRSGEMVTIDSDEVYDKILVDAFGSSNIRSEAEIKIYLKRLASGGGNNNSFFKSGSFF